MNRLFSQKPPERFLRRTRTHQSLDKPGSETRRAVTTVGGATKLTVRSQLLTRDGEIVIDRTVHGNVRFFGSNLHATHNLACNISDQEIKRGYGPGFVPRYSAANFECQPHAMIRRVRYDVAAR